MQGNLQEGFTCYYEHCSKAFASKFNLRRHVNATHLEIKNYACDLCPRHFASKQGLVEHRFIHTGERPFYCSVCGKRFRQASQLCMHRKCHRQTGSQLQAFPMIKLTDLLRCETELSLQLPTATPTFLPIITQLDQEQAKLPVIPALIYLDKSHTF